MSDFHDVVTAIHEADHARANLDSYMGQVEDGRTGDPTLAIGLASVAVCAHLSALTTRLDYLAHVFGEKRRGG